MARCVYDITQQAFAKPSYPSSGGRLSVNKGTGSKEREEAEWIIIPLLLNPVIYTT